MCCTKEKRKTSILSFGLSIMVCACLCVFSVFDVSASSAVSSVGIVDMQNFNVLSSEVYQGWNDSYYSSPGAVNKYPDFVYCSLSAPSSATEKEFNAVRVKFQYDESLILPEPGTSYKVTFYVMISNLATTKDAYLVRYTRPGPNGDVVVQSNAYVDDTDGYRKFYFDFVLTADQIVNNFRDFTFLVNLDNYPTVSSFQFRDLKIVKQGRFDGIASEFGEYSDPDTGAADDYYNTESALIDQIDPGINDMLDDWLDIPGTIFEFQSGFFAIASFFNALAGIPFISALLIISVCVGVFALLLGAVGHFAGKG